MTRNSQTRRFRRAMNNIPRSHTGRIIFALDQQTGDFRANNFNPEYIDNRITHQEASDILKGLRSLESWKAYNLTQVLPRKALLIMLVLFVLFVTFLVASLISLALGSFVGFLILMFAMAIPTVVAFQIYFISRACRACAKAALADKRRDEFDQYLRGFDRNLRDKGLRFRSGEMGAWIELQNLQMLPGGGVEFASSQGERTTGKFYQGAGDDYKMQREGML